MTRPAGVIEPAAPPLSPVTRRVAALFVFAAAMGWLEAVVVVYIRAVIGLARTETIPVPEEIARRFAEHPWLMPTEQGREVATLLMLGAIAWIAADSARRRMGAFLICFGVWDIAYYLGLYSLLRWPPNLLTMDLLFLIPPHPWWYQPVWIPVAISCVMIAIGIRWFSSPATR